MGKEKRKVTSVRVEAWKKELVEKSHGSFQAWIDVRLDEELAIPHEAVIVRLKKEKVSTNDF